MGEQTYNGIVVDFLGERRDPVVASPVGDDFIMYHKLAQERFLFEGSLVPKVVWWLHVGSTKPAPMP